MDLIDFTQRVPDNHIKDVIMLGPNVHPLPSVMLYQLPSADDLTVAKPVGPLAADGFSRLVDDWISMPHVRGSL